MVCVCKCFLCAAWTWLSGLLYLWEKLTASAETGNVSHEELICAEPEMKEGKQKEEQQNKDPFNYIRLVRKRWKARGD